jgi:hypothetical protein
MTSEFRAASVVGRVARAKRSRGAELSFRTRTPRGPTTYQFHSTGPEVERLTVHEKAESRARDEIAGCAPRAVRLDGARERSFDSHSDINNKTILNITCSTELRERDSCGVGPGANKRHAGVVAANHPIAPIAPRALAASRATDCEVSDGRRPAVSPAGITVERLRGGRRPISITDNPAKFTSTPPSGSGSGFGAAAAAALLTLNARGSGDARNAGAADRTLIGSVGRSRSVTDSGTIDFLGVDNIPNRPGRVVINFPSRPTEPGAASAS